MTETKKKAKLSYAIRCYYATEDRSTSVKRFSALADAAKYVFDRYQGVEYFDGPAGFHDDYVQYTLVGFMLRDIYEIDYPNYHATRKSFGDEVERVERDLNDGEWERGL